MSDMLPVKSQRKWIVDSKGSAVEQKTKPKKLSSGQRHYMYRLGLLAVDNFLKERGFQTHGEGSNSSFSYEKKGALIDVKIADPGNIAFVTSHVGYEYKQEVIGKAADGQERYGVKATVITAKDVMGSDKMIQILISANDASGTRNPIFVPLPKDLDNPAQHVLKQVLGTIALACESIPKLRDAFTEEKVVEAQAQPIDVSSIPLLPD